MAFTSEPSLNVEGVGNEDKSDIQVYNSLPSSLKIKSTTSQTQYAYSPIPKPLGSKGSVAIKEGFWPVLWSLAIHVLSLATTAVLLWLNFDKVFAFEKDLGVHTDDDDEDDGLLSTVFSWSAANVLGALQFVAKAHEVLIIFSLSQMILFFVRRRLVNDDRGMPLGLLSYGFMNPSFAALLEGSFWSGPSAVLLTSFILLCTLIAGLAVPSSAILLVPSLSWWPVPTSLQPDITPIYIGGSDVWNYPLTLDASSLDPACMNGSSVLLCPGGDAAEMFVWAAAYANTGVGSNLSLTEGLGGARRYLTAFETKPNAQSRGSTTIATTLKTNIVLLHGLLANYVKGKDAGRISKVKDARYSLRYAAPAPIVQVSCDARDYTDARNTSLTESDPDTYYTPVVSRDSMLCFNMSQRDCGDQTSQIIGGELGQRVWNFSRPLDVVNFTWFDIEVTQNNFSLGAMATLPYLMWSSTTDNTTIRSMLLSCAIDARWTPASTLYEPSRSDVVVSNISRSQTFLRKSAAALQASQPIDISAAWAKSLNLPYNSSGKTHPFMESLLWYRIQNQTADGSVKGLPNGTQATFIYTDTENLQDSFRNMSKVVATYISMAVANGLSRLTYSADVVYTNKTGAFDPKITLESLVFQEGYYHDRESSYAVTSDELSKFTVVELAFEQYGYGWGVRTVTWYIGVIVLLLHTVMVLIFVAIRLVMYFVGSEKGEIVAWGTIPELLVLALKSRPVGQLDGAGAGVGKTQWRLPVRVKETVGDCLEMVVGRGESGGQEVEVGKKYR
ncbi:hypothetical protein N0V90_000649 [Kalmusia sp. IMI 367209]|nr:hypothetical protein N0V90_000649 [Kalmusia sp. IMI 367209]